MNEDQIKNNTEEIDNENMTICGIDVGLSDLDIPRNDDRHAILHGLSSNNLAIEPNFADGIFYYSSPVVIRIPQSLMPLPNQLLQNPMNLLVCCS